MASFPMMSRFRRIQPKTEAFDEYSEHASSIPQQEDYAPSVWRRIAAGLAGGLTALRDPSHGMKVTDTILNDKYRNAISQHGMRTKSLQDMAKLEQEANEASFKFENDMAQREETARYHDLTNERFEEDREARREASERAAAQKDVENDLRSQDLTRRQQSDQMLNNYRKRQGDIAAQRAKAYQEFVNKYGQKQESDKVNPLDQGRIRKLAVIETMKDPRFAKVPVFEDGSYDTSKLDPALQQEFETAIKIHESSIVKKKKSDYDFSGDTDIRDEDFEFERRLQEDDDDDGFFR